MSFNPEDSRVLKLEIDGRCLAACLEDIVLGNVFSVFASMTTLAELLMIRIDEGYEVRRAIYNALYTLVKMLGLSDYFEIAEHVDECFRCIDYKVLERRQEALQKLSQVER